MVARQPPDTYGRIMNGEHVGDTFVHSMGATLVSTNRAARGTSVSRLELPRLLDGGKFEPVPSPGVKARKQHQIQRVTNYLVPLLESD